MRSFSREEGEALVKAARNSIELYLKNPDFDRKLIERTLEGFEERQGVFVTVNMYPTKELRGCIGFARSSGQLKSLIIEAAIASAVHDPRFKPLSHLELEHVVVEVNLLSEMKRMKSNPDSIKREIKIGQDGLFLEYGYYSGLLLPIVAVEQGWNKEQFLENLCSKAGIEKEAWKRPDISIYRFRNQVFTEKSPGGMVEEVKLK